MTERTQPLDVLEVPLSGINLIEASAGTGKTHTITNLYLRLVLETAHPVNRILVVTYTRAATNELRERVLGRLLEVREMLSRGSRGDDFGRAVLQRCHSRGLEQELLVRRLTNAVRGFDEAAIFTVHGFCQRVLADSAFESGVAFGNKLLPDQRELLQNIVDDFWRREFYQASPLLVNYLLDQAYSPEVLLDEIEHYVGKPYFRVLGPEAALGLGAIEQRFVESYAKARHLWQSRREEIADLIRDNVSLNANRYRRISIPGWFALLEEYLASQTPNLRLFDKFEKFTASHLVGSVKKGCRPPQHAFFEACDELQQAHARLADYCRRFLLERRVVLLNFCNRELGLRKRQQQVQSYDDLLLDLRRALLEQGGEDLAGTIRRRYSAALVDEFQDTDPVQYEIFRRIYAGSGLPLFLVGDPKQAIYSFRGADIFTYLRARRDATRCYSLAVNWRSSPRLVEALNALFGRVSQPFLFNNIPFRPVEPAAAHREPLLLEKRSEYPLRIWLVEGDEEGRPLNKASASELAAHATALEIGRLLELSAKGEAVIGERPLEGGDIAVLVRNHRQGRMIREQLLGLGVSSVQQAQDSVFASREALQLERLLLAVAQPHQEQGVRAALVTDLMGLSGEDLYRMAQDEREWEERLEAFHSYHDLWRESGFIRMFRAFLAKEDVFRRLLGFRDGERRLTNLLHLAELLQARTSQAHVGMAGLIKWLAERRRSRPSAEEEQQLRLESDEHLVKIVTVHKSKGLEYPVVFCPFLWDGKLWSAKADIISFHDLNDPDYPVLDIGSPHQEQHRDYAHHEEAAENLRLLYVALTRAKQLCYLVWGNIQEAGTSAPAWLLHPPLDFDGRHADPQASDYDRLLAAARRVQTLGGQAMREELELLAQRAPQTVQISSLPVEGELRPPRQLARGTPQLGARRFRRAIGGGWQITSFTALTLGKGGEGPDYEEIADALEELPQTPAEEQAVSGFPRGAQAGACLHTLLERMDFSQRNRARLESLVKETLEEYGFGTECSDSALEMIERVLATPLEEGGPCLRQVSLKRRLSELEFHYPLAGLTPTGLQRVLYAHGFGSGAFRDAIDKLDFSFSRGYLKGYIDLVFEAGGRFYLVDYKSNCLGMDPGAYRAELLAEVMASEAYYLQYLIYTVALHRYLRRRLHGYDYERHFGAVYYLFLRGMDPTLGSSHGIYRDRPSESLVRALDSYLASAGSG